MLLKKLEQRYRQIQEYLLQGKSYEWIANKLGVTIQTICSDVKEINARYKKLVLENSDYLARHLEHVLQRIDELDYIKSRLYEIEEQASEGQDDKSVRNQIQALKEVTNIVEKQAKLQNLISPDVTFIQNNYISVDQFNIIFSKIADILQSFVPKERLIEALTQLKAIDVVKKD